MAEELPRQFIEHNQETKHTREINAMQVELIKSWNKDVLDPENLPVEEERPSKWIELYSKKFRDIIDRELDKNPNFWEDFKKPKFRKELIARIKEKLYLKIEEPLKIAA